MRGDRRAALLTLALAFFSQRAQILVPPSPLQWHFLPPGPSRADSLLLLTSSLTAHVSQVAPAFVRRLTAYLVGRHSALWLGGHARGPARVSQCSQEVRTPHSSCEDCAFCLVSPSGFAFLSPQS